MKIIDIHLIHSIKFKLILLISIIFIIFIFILLYKKEITKNKNILDKIYNLENFEIDNIPPEKYERNVLDEVKNKIDGKSIIPINQLYFINGLIRKYKPKKIIEIGVCSGGTSAVILNAIRDIEGAKLYSCDLEKKHYLKSAYDVGFIVKNYFPEFLNKWKLFTGNTTSAFIEEIGEDIDFAFIDTAHVMPGEVLNVIEILPFLKKNAIIAFDDINQHAKKVAKITNDFHSCNNLLFSVLRGKKIIFDQSDNKTFNFKKLGAVILDDNQEKYFYEYFYLLTNNWSYMPKKFEIETIRVFVKKYFHPFFFSMFNKAVEMNYQYLKMKGLLDKDYILYTYEKSKRKNPYSKMNFNN